MRSVPLLLFALFWALYTLCSPGVINNPDSATRFLTAVSLARTGSIELTLPGVDPERFETTRDVHGKWVEFFTEGQSMMLAPFLTPLVHAPLARADDLKILEFYIAAVVLPLTAALTLPAFWLFLRLFCDDDRVNLTACLLLGASTYFLVYAYNGHQESQIALFLILHAYGLIRYFRGEGDRCLILAAVTLGAIVLWRPNLVYYAPIAAAWILWEGCRQGWTWRRLAGAEVVLTAVSMVVFSPQLYFNYLKTGNPILLPYGQGGIGLAWQLSGTFGQGLRVCLLSPGKSVFLFNPIAAVSATLFIILLKRMVREPFFPLFIYGLANAVFTLHLVYWTEHGEISWGPRFFAHTAFLFVLPAWYAMRVMPSRGLTAVVTVAALLGMFVQLLGTLYAAELDSGAARAGGVYGGESVMNDTPVLAWRARDLVELAWRRGTFTPERFQQLPNASRYFVPQWWWCRLLADDRYGVPAPLVWLVVIGLVATGGAAAAALVRASNRGDGGP